MDTDPSCDAESASYSGHPTSSEEPVGSPVMLPRRSFVTRFPPPVDKPITTAAEAAEHLRIANAGFLTSGDDDDDYNNGNSRMSHFPMYHKPKPTSKRKRTAVERVVLSSEPPTSSGYISDTQASVSQHAEMRDDLKAAHVFVGRHTRAHSVDVSETPSPEPEHPTTYTDIPVSEFAPSSSANIEEYCGMGLRMPHSQTSSSPLGPQAKRSRLTSSWIMGSESDDQDEGSE